MVPFFDMRGHLGSVAGELQEAYARVIASGMTILGPELEAFEAEFAAYCGARYCVGVGNGLESLALALKARGIGSGDEVIVPAQTFIASWLAVSEAGATPVPVDVEDTNCSLDPALVERAVTPRTRAIMPVHLFGQPADMPALRRIADRHRLFLLEDAAQAHGASVGNRRAGSLGDAAAFSFYPTKNLGAIGDGGAVVTDDEDLARQLRLLRNYGSSEKYLHEIAAGNSRLDEMQAAFLRVKLRHLDSWNVRRRAIAERYRDRLGRADALKMPVDRPDDSSVFHLFVVRTPSRDALQQSLREAGIGTQIHYPYPPHRQEAYRQLGFAPEEFPVANTWASQSLSLPIWPQMTDGQVDEVAAAIERAMLYAG